MNDGHSSILRIERQLVMCAARKRSDKIIHGLIEQCMMLILLLSFYLTHTLSRLVLQNVLCSARTAGKWTEKPAHARAIASGKARIHNPYSYMGLYLRTFCRDCMVTSFVPIKYLCQYFVTERYFDKVGTDTCKWRVQNGHPCFVGYMKLDCIKTCVCGT